ncbi:MAG: fatty acid desaturase, partial [Bacteriovoracaceae bacterium]|nr:fatty acid desaturase [Bacteriovoracaceae bacterium]
IPEYNRKTLLTPVISAFILPLFQIFRFGVLPLVLPLMPEKYQLYVYERMSTLVFDVNFKRKIKNKKEELKIMKFNDLMCSIYKVLTVILIMANVLPLRFITYFYLGFVFCSILNMYRALFNHLYTNESLAPLKRDEHILDTTTVESGLLTIIIFVNGLNYHTLHHLFPEIPYYRLGSAHRLLMKELPVDHLYRKSVYSSLFSLLKFCQKERKNNVLFAS